VTDTVTEAVTEAERTTETVTDPVIEAVTIPAYMVCIRERCKPQPSPAAQREIITGIISG
jgi:hypothetical protein